MSRVRGTNKLRRTLKRMPPHIKWGVQDSLRLVAKDVERDAIGWALTKDIKDSGDMIASISTNFSSDKLSVHIGPGADRAYVRKNPFSQTVLDKALLPKTFRRGGRTIRRTKSERKGLRYMRDSNARYQFMKGYWHEFGTRAVEPMPPHPLPPRPFMNEAWQNNRVRARLIMNAAVNRAIRRTISGG